MAEQTPPFRPLYFLAGYPYSGSERIRAMTFAVAMLTRKDPPKRLDFSQIDNVVPWDIHERLYQMATGKSPKALSEAEIAEARGAVHRLIAERFPGLPVVRTQSMRATFHGHRTINGTVSRGATYVVRNPIDVAVSISRSNRIEPLKAISLMVQQARRVRPHKQAVIEPQGSWSQNVDSWTAQNDKHIHVVHHEDLVRRPSKTFEDIFRHMRFNVSGKVLDTALKAVKQARGDMTLHTMKDLKPLEVRALLEVNAVAMERHGYLSDTVLDYAQIEREEALAKSLEHNKEPVPTTAANS